MTHYYDTPETGKMIENDQPLSPWEELKKGALTNADVERMESTELLTPLIARGACTIFCSPAQGGKTATLMVQASEMAKLDFEVVYILADEGQGRIKDKFRPYAEKHGFCLTVPHIKEPDHRKTKEILNKMAHQDNDLSKMVCILDTLTKFISVNDSREVRSFTDICRKLTGRGMTVILVHHTNKYGDDEDNLVYKGLSDLRDNVDNLILLKPVYDAVKQTLEITTDLSGRHGKNRSGIPECAFTIEIDDSLKFDVGQEAFAEKRRESDKTIINFVIQKLEQTHSGLTQSELEQARSQDNDVNNPFGKRKLAQCLKIHAEQKNLWIRRRGENNAWIYTLPPN